MRRIARRLIPAFCFGLALAGPRAALAEPPDEPDDGVNSAAIASLQRERDGLSRGGPVALICVGGAVGLISLGFVNLRYEQRMSEGGWSSDPPPSPMGLYVASTLGFMAAIGGIVWLIDVNHERIELDERIARLRRNALVVPVLDPTTKTAAISVLGHF
jgi:hypothetical protein